MVIVMQQILAKQISSQHNVSRLCAVSLVIVLALSAGCGKQVERPETEPIPFGSQLAQTKGDASQAATTDGEGAEQTGEGQAEQAAVSKKMEPITLDLAGPGRAYIDATSPEDRAQAAAIGSQYINNESQSKLDRLVLAPISPLANFWDLPERFDKYEQVGSLLVFEAYCDGSKIPNRLAVIKENKYWIVKHFGRLSEEEQTHAKEVLDSGASPDEIDAAEVAKYQNQGA